MKKSVSIREDLAIKAMDEVYIRNAFHPEKPTSFSKVVNDALEFFLNAKAAEVNVCKK